MSGFPCGNIYRTTVFVIIILINIFELASSKLSRLQGRHFATRRAGMNEVVNGSAF